MQKRSRSGSFTDNMTLPVHRWFRYSAGFSAEWAEEVIRAQGDPGVVFDPFAGSGTTLISAQKAGMASAGVENHDFVHRIASAKLLWSLDATEFHERSRDLVALARGDRSASPATPSALLRRCYEPEALVRLEALKRSALRLGCEDGTRQLLWLALTSILRECSGAGTAQWQYILPNKRKARVQDPFDAFAAKCDLIGSDMAAMKASVSPDVPPVAELHCADARRAADLEHLRGRVGLVLTSPPYPNNYDYADATRLEMTFWDEVAGWGDLQSTVRHRLIRSCSQHSAAEKLALSDLLEEQAVEPIKDELRQVCGELADIRATKGGKKTYHTMVAAYFVDLARVWLALRPLCRDGAQVCFVIGDSAPYGVYVPVDRWLGELALAAGFKKFSFERMRDRNTKWKNRKHRVPLKEGHLLVEG
jgi:hypothetical protein